MNNFDAGKLKQQLSEISQKIESDMDAQADKMGEFFQFLNYQDLMIVRQDDKTNKRWQEINAIYERFVKENLTEREVKILLEGNDIETSVSPLNRIFREWCKYHLASDRVLQTSHRFFSQIKFEQTDLELLEQFPNNLSDGRIQEILFCYGEFYDGITDLRQTEKNLYPTKFTEVKNQ